MATTGLQLLGFILGVIAWSGMISTCASPEWRKNSVGGTTLDEHKRFDGLWVQCEQMPNGNTNCESYNVFFIGLPEVLQTCRALMIAAIGLGFLGILLSVLGMKCTSVGASNHKAKARTALLGGLMLGVAAACTGASVSYYAHQVVQEYFNPVLPYNQPLYLRFEYGSALFIGWVSLVIGVLSSVILSAASLMVLSKIAKGEIIQSGYLKKHLGYKQLEGLRTQNALTHAVQEYV